MFKLVISAVLIIILITYININVTVARIKNSQSALVIISRFLHVTIGKTTFHSSVVFSLHRNIVSDIHE